MYFDGEVSLVLEDSNNNPATETQFQYRFPNLILWLSEVALSRNFRTIRSRSQIFGILPARSP